MPSAIKTFVNIFMGWEKSSDKNWPIYEYRQMIFVGWQCQLTEVFCSIRLSWIYWIYCEYVEYIVCLQRTNVERDVVPPLNSLLLMFQGPYNLIRKRYDKLLDYENSANRLGSLKDSDLVSTVSMPCVNLIWIGMRHQYWSACLLTI